MSNAGDSLLRALRDATFAYEADPRYASWDGYFISFGNAHGLKPALLGSASGLDIHARLIDELTDLGYVQQVEPPAGSAGGRKFTLTSEGHAHAAAEGGGLVGAQSNPTVVSGDQFDVFLSHASEDKDEVVLPLAAELERRGIRVWLDKQQLTLGDSLSQKIDEGLAGARFGVVVLSRSFFSKNWPVRELDGLVARETTFGSKVILPIWHNITRKEILAYSPTLANKLAVDTSLGIDAIAAQIQEVLGGPLHAGQMIRLVDEPAASDTPPARRDSAENDLLTVVREAVLGQRQGDVRAHVVRQISAAEAATTAGDEDGFRASRKDLTTIAAAVVAATPQDPLAAFAVDAYHRLFETSGPLIRRGGPEANSAINVWPDLLAHVRAVGALLVRFELWDLTRRLAEHRPPPDSVDMYPGWICFVEVQLARRRGHSNAETIRQPLRRAAELIASLPALAPDGPSENIRLDSVLRFDLLSRVVETSLAAREGRPTETYPPFARFDVTPLRPLVRRLIEQPSFVDQLLPGLSHDEVINVLRIVDANAQRAVEQHSFWDGIADPDLQRQIRSGGL